MPALSYVLSFFPWQLIQCHNPRIPNVMNFHKWKQKQKKKNNMRH